MNKPSQIETLGFTLNGEPVTTSAFPGERLSELLREKLDARDVKIGCNAGDCGACSVLIDGSPVCACLTPAQQAAGKNVETARGLAQSDPVGKELEQRLQDHGAAQCGICTPGMVVSAVALLRQDRHPNELSVKDALGGVLCRCTGYRKIIDAVMDRPSGLDDGAGHTGESLRKLDGAAKTQGLEIFGDDAAPPGTLEVMVVRSPYPRARFTIGDLERFASDHGLEATLTAQDIPGQNLFGVIPNFVDQPVFAERDARFRGEAVAALVGSPEILRQIDLQRVPIDWVKLPSVEEPEAAKQADAPQLHDTRAGNIMCGGFVETGCVQTALETATHKVHGTFSTGFVEHAYIEPEAGFARMVGERVEIHACTQAPIMDLEALEAILAMDRKKIRIVPTAAGGGFGAKLDLSVQPYLALATLKTGKPVRLCYSRVESMQCSTKRHPSQIHMEITAKADGTISGLNMFGTFDTGAYASWGPTVANRVPVHASGPYSIPNYRAETEAVHTHNPPAGAFRGFGVPQAAIAQECLFDELADALGVDALEFRIANALQNGTRTVCGQVFEQGVGIKECLEALRPAWAQERAACARFNAEHSTLKRGVGVGAGWYGCGNTSLPNPSTIKSGVTADGRIVLHQGAVDIGQGANTVIAQIFAQALGLPLDRISLVGPDTDVTPDAGKTSASRQTYVSGNAARLSGEALRAAILTRLNAGDDASLAIDAGWVIASDGSDQQRLQLTDLPQDADGYVFGASETYDPPTEPLDEKGQGAPYAQFGYAAHLAVVEVDTELGTTRAVRFVAAHDVGKAINPLLVEGQVHGGIAQGLGMALMEAYIPGRTENLHDYLIPTIGDIPEIETHIIEAPDAHGPYGAKGLGEHALIPTAPALLNAIANATGVRMTSVPVTPDKLRAGILSKDRPSKPSEAST